MRDNIYKGFSKDHDLLNLYHIEAGRGLEACVNRTCKDLENVHPSFTFFEYREKGKLIGFFGREWSNYINTIFVMPEYRTKEYMPKFWNFITSKVTVPFYTALYSKNTPAINFYLKNGGKILTEFDTKDGKAVYIEVK